MEEIFRCIVGSIENSKLKPEFGQRGLLGSIMHVGETETPGDVRWGSECDLFSRTKGNMQTP